MASAAGSPTSPPLQDNVDAERRLREAEERLREAIEELQRRQRKAGAAARSSPHHNQPQHCPPCCEHAAYEPSCVANAIGNLCQTFLLSYGVRVGIGILLRAFKLARRQSYSSLIDLKQLVSEKDLIVREEACRIGLFFGGFTGSYQALRCLLRKLRKKETPFNAILAGSIAGLSILALDDSNRRRTLALYLLARLAQCAYNSAKSKDKFHFWGSHWRHGDSLLFAFACAQVMYSFVMRPESLPKSYQDFIQKTGPVAQPVYKAVRDSCRGFPVDVASLSAYLSGRRNPNHVKLEEFPAIIPCSVIHPDTNSCLTHNANAASATFRKTFPLYFSLTFVPFVVLHLQKFMDAPARTCWLALKGAVRSTTFLSAFVGIFQGVICLHRKVASKDHKIVYWIAGGMAALSVLLEKKARRSELALYDLSPSGNSLSPVMIPPPRHSSDTTHRPVPFPPVSPLRRDTLSLTVGSYNNSNNIILSSSPTASFYDESKGIAVKASSVPASGLTTVSVVKTLPPGFTETIVEKVGGSVEMQNDLPANSKPLKERTSKAERRALQEAQRAAKAAAKAEGSKLPATTSGAVASANAKPTKATKPPSQKNDSATVASSEKKGGDRPPEKDRKKDAPHPRMQYDDKSRVEKAKRRAVVKQTEARNRVELFRHLPQYEHGTQLPDLESKFFQLDPVHPVVYKVGLQYISGDISGGNARCIAMLQAFQEAIKDYSTPDEKTLTRDLTAKINSYVSFLNECRPLSISMGNAIRFLKNRIAKLPLTLSESEAKAFLQSDIEQFINEKIILADKVIVKHAVTKIRDGDVLLTYGSSSAVEMILLHAHELGKQFRVVIVDSRPKLEGQLLLRRLVGKGLSCTYANINAVSYIMHEVTRVFLGASSVLSNGTVYSRVGTACVAMVAHEFRVPVLVCCEAYKFHERVQLDSICSNELGDPDAISKVPGREDINYLDGCTNSENLQLLNLIYDATPSDYVSMIVTDYGMVPPTSVPVIVREYCRDQVWI